MLCEENLLPLIQANVPIVLIMDDYQLHAVKHRWHDWSSAPIIKELFKGNIIRLKYRENSSRYDQTMYTVLQHLKKTGKLHPILRDPKHKIDPCLTRNISFTNPKRKAINERILEAEIQAKQITPTIIGKKRYYEGLNIIAHQNNKKFKYFNSQISTIIQIDEDTVKLKGEYRTIKIPHSKLSDFDYAFCTTTHKSQGRTIPEPYNIYEVNKMTRRLIYTALSRAKSVDQIHLTWTDKTFELDNPETDPEEITIQKPDLVKCKIYEIKDATQNYVGRTTTTLEQRFHEHCTSVNEPPKMKQFVNNGKAKIGLIYEADFHSDDTYGMAELEKYFIRKLNPTLNVQNKPMPIPNNPCKTQHIVPVHLKDNKCQIKDDNHGRLRINWTEAGTPFQKKFRYSTANKKEVMLKAEAFRNELLGRMYGAGLCY
jgi:hypothetical protein